MLKKSFFLSFSSRCRHKAERQLQQQVFPQLRVDVSSRHAFDQSNAVPPPVPVVWIWFLNLRIELTVKVKVVYFPDPSPSSSLTRLSRWRWVCSGSSKACSFLPPRSSTGWSQSRTLHRRWLATTWPRAKRIDNVGC